MKILRKIIHIDEEKCNGCGQCILSCAEGAIVLRDGKAKVIGDMYCDGLGACMGSCPTDALTIIEREADPFNEEAVEALLASQQKQAGGCIGSAQFSFAPATSRGISASANDDFTPHWPVKLRLTNPQAPYLQNAHLYLVADCAAFAAINFHGLLTDGPTALLTFCPKFESEESIMTKLTEIFATGHIRACTTIRMEVPCCNGLVLDTTKALAACPHPIPHKAIILSRHGEPVLA